MGVEGERPREPCCGVRELAPAFKAAASRALTAEDRRLQKIILNILYIDVQNRLVGTLALQDLLTSRDGSYTIKRRRTAGSRKRLLRDHGLVIGRIRPIMTGGSLARFFTLPLCPVPWA